MFPKEGEDAFRGGKNRVCEDLLSIWRDLGIGNKEINSQMPLLPELCLNQQWLNMMEPQAFRLCSFGSTDGYVWYTLFEPRPKPPNGLFRGDYNHSVSLRDFLPGFWLWLIWAYVLGVHLRIHQVFQDVDKTFNQSHNGPPIVQRFLRSHQDQLFAGHSLQTSNPQLRLMLVVQ